ncbi:hypothetical protein PIB30_028346 [Stylosanthes scabra]|uniref:F-box domain-containing protein n=1 Tax=Stylosanthes scabra TaxID=79078 RepID=A0ABU6QAF6_9FABA|nr:hypothetical protein [Stylosanthes scabra]
MTMSTRSKMTNSKNNDMISSLPDCLLFFILSSFPFKEAARTCLLSKRWLAMWRSSNVKNTQLQFPAAAAAAGEGSTFFVNFITNWIIEHKNLIEEKFSLTVSPPPNCGDVIGICVDFAISNTAVKDLELDFHKPQWNYDENENENENHDVMVELPKSFYNQINLQLKLESLKLYSCRFDPVDFANFHALTDLTLGWIPLNIQTLKTVLWICKSSLRSLTLKRCWDLQHLRLGEETERLTRLVIEKCRFKIDYWCFEAPNLEYFKFCGNVGISHIRVQLGKIEEADLDFGALSEFFAYGFAMCRVLEDFRPARVLTVCSVFLQLFPASRDGKPLHFHGGLAVRHLTVKTQLHRQELYGFMFLLTKCYVLEKLTIHLDKSCNVLSGYRAPDGVNLDMFWEKTKHPGCMKRLLKVVEIKGFMGTREQLNACHYFIKFGRVLKKLTITVLNEENENPAIVELRRNVALHLLDVPRTSKDLVIKIS